MDENTAPALSRNLPAFSRFLDLASLSDSEQVEYSTFASDVGVSSPTIKAYFEILQDTLLGEHLEVYRKKVKRRLVVSMENQRRVTSDGIEILPYLEFLDELWSWTF